MSDLLWEPGTDQQRCPSTRGDRQCILVDHHGASELSPHDFGPSHKILRHELEQAINSQPPGVLYAIARRAITALKDAQTQRATQAGYLTAAEELRASVDLQAKTITRLETDNEALRHEITELKAKIEGLKAVIRGNGDARVELLRQLQAVEARIAADDVALPKPLFDDVLDVLDNYADVNDGDGGPVPNRALALHAELRRFVEAAKS